MTLFGWIVFISVLVLFAISLLSQYWLMQKLDRQREEALRHITFEEDANAEPRDSVIYEFKRKK